MRAINLNETATEAVLGQLASMFYIVPYYRIQKSAMEEAEDFITKATSSCYGDDVVRLM